MADEVAKTEEDVKVKILDTKFDSASGLAQADVEFANPWNTGPKDEINNNKMKTINIPINSATGEILEDEWQQRLKDHRRAQFGMMQRVADSARAAAKASVIKTNLAGLKGSTMDLTPKEEPKAENNISADKPPEEENTETEAGKTTKKSNTKL